jgi:DNA-binding transcriptional LysR family regulator
MGPGMALDPYRRIARLWNWLPAFRAVAEYESVQAAGAALALSPSALSRAVRLVEDELGEPLFVRAPDGLQLTARGRALLSATRDAMRGIDEALGPPREALDLRIGAVDTLLAAVLARAASPVFATGRTLSLRLVAPLDVGAHLFRGDAGFFSYQYQFDVLLPALTCTSTA